MFEFLETADARQALPAGHEAIQFIRQWALAAARSGLPSSFEGLPPQQVEVAKRIVKEIEAREGRPVADISRDKIEEYIKLVSERLQSLARRQFVVGQINGVALLDRLRLVK